MTQMSYLQEDFFDLSFVDRLVHHLVWGSIKPLRLVTVYFFASGWPTAINSRAVNVYGFNARSSSHPAVRSSSRRSVKASRSFSRSMTEMKVLSDQYDCVFTTLKLPRSATVWPPWERDAS